MTDKSLVVQTLLDFFFFSGQQKKQVRKTRQIEENLKNSKEGRETEMVWVGERSCWMFRWGVF